MAHEQKLTSTKERETPEVVESVLDLDFAVRIEESFSVSADDTARVAEEGVVGQAGVVDVLEAVRKEVSSETTTAATRKIPIADSCRWGTSAENLGGQRRAATHRVSRLGSLRRQGRRSGMSSDARNRAPSHQIIASSSSTSPARSSVPLASSNPSEDRTTLASLEVRPPTRVGPNASSSLGDARRTPRSDVHELARLVARLGCFLLEWFCETVS